MRLLLPALAAAFLCALVAAPLASAKQDVTARLERPLNLNAKPGSRTLVVWSLTYKDTNGARKPFGASGLFVQLRSATTRRWTKAHGRMLAPGRYRARVRVPRGGMGGIRFGLEGIRIVAGKTSDADVYFPLENDPFAVDAGAGVVGTA